MSHSNNDLVLEALLRIAKQHGEDSEPDHEVGDLQDLLRPMWKLLTPDQRNAFMASDEVRNVMQGATGEDGTICDIEDVDPQELEEAAQYLARPLPESIDHAGRIAVINEFRIRQFADQSSVGAGEGRFVFGIWTHIFFEYGPDTTTRIVFDRQVNAVVAMEIASSGPGKWTGATWEQCAELTDSILNANEEALEFPGEWGLQEGEFPPRWSEPYLGATEGALQSLRPRE